MSRYGVLHVGSVDKFLPDFIDLVQQEFDARRHCFLLYSKAPQTALQRYANVRVFSGRLSRWRFFLALLFTVYRADRIMLHSLFDTAVVRFLALQPWLLHKCYWLIWGGDLYRWQPSPSGQEPPVSGWKDRFDAVARRRVFGGMGHLVTYVPGDVALVRAWFGATGQHHDCLLYPSNVVTGAPDSHIPHAGLNLLVGNSADPSNFHEDVFRRLQPLVTPGMRVFVPLSYGRKANVDKVMAAGQALLGDAFQPLLDFMPLADYQALLSTIDIALFNHDRQQAMGNMIALVGMGKKVFMRPQVTSWSVFQAAGARVFDIGQVDLSPLDEATRQGNMAAIRQHFSRHNLNRQLAGLFGE
jgi:hypothetical protein